MTDQDAIALTCWGEARGEPVEGRIAVGCVLRNRVDEGRWGSTYGEVALAHDQFSCWNETDANFPLLNGLLAQLLAGQTPDDKVFRECQWIADGIVSGRTGYRVGIASHYYAITAAKVPDWAVGARLVARVGHQLFFAGVQ